MEYGQFLERIGRLFGVVVETPQMAASVVAKIAKTAGIPLVRVIILDVSDLLKEISSYLGKGPEPPPARPIQHWVLTWNRFDILHETLEETTTLMTKDPPVVDDPTTGLEPTPPLESVRSDASSISTTSLSPHFPLSCSRLHLLPPSHYHPYFPLPLHHILPIRVSRVLSLDL